MDIKSVIIAVLVFLVFVMITLLFVAKILNKEKPEAERKWTDPNSRR